MARGEVEQDIVELVISSQTQTAQNRPAGLPPVRRAFPDLAVSLQSDATAQDSQYVTPTVESQTKMLPSSPKDKSFHNVLFYAVAYAICLFIYLMAAFVIGELHNIFFPIHVNCMTGVPLQLFLEISFRKVPLFPGPWPLVWQLFLRSSNLQMSAY